MDPNEEGLPRSYRVERIGSYLELPNANHSTATNHYPVSSWVAEPPLPDSENSSTEQSQSEVEETRAPLERNTSTRNVYVQTQTDFDSTPHSKDQRQAEDKKPESRFTSRYDCDPWATWDSNTQSQPTHHHLQGYQQDYPRPAPGASIDRNPFTRSTLTPYASDNRYASANYDYRPYGSNSVNPLVHSSPNYAQPWTQPISTVSMPHALTGPSIDSGAKDFSSYSYAPPPLRPGPNNWQGHGITGSSQSLPGRLQSKDSDDSDDDRRGVIVPGDGLHAGSSSQSRKSRKRPSRLSRRTELSVTKGSPTPQTTPIPVSSTLGGTEAVSLPPSRSHSPLDLDSTLENDVLPPLPPLPALGRRSSRTSGTIQEPFSQKLPHAGEHRKSPPEDPRIAKEVRPDQNDTLHEDLFNGLPNLDDLLDTGKAADVKAAKRGKNSDRKAKAARRNPVVVEVPLQPMSPPMPPPPNHASPPFLQPGQEPTIIEFERPPRMKKLKEKRTQRSGFEDWVAGQTIKSSKRFKSPYAKRVNSLMSCMPHLEALYSFKRDPETSPAITRLDYKNNIENPRHKSRRVFRSRDWLGPYSKNFAKKLSSGGTSSVFLRVLFVEDLTSSLIDTLGELYGVDPELFASHMSSSGSSTLSYDDPPPARWRTAKMRKSYYSLKWYRPVRLEKRVSQWLRNPKDLAKLEEDGIEWSETTHERRGQDTYETKTHHSVTLNNNIFRRSWPLSSDPDGAPGDGLHAAWEEKASVFIAPKDGLTISEYLL